MINYELIKRARTELKLSQGVVAETVSKMSGQTFSQQAYGKIEKGITRNTSLLPYICHVLQLDINKADPALDAVASGTKNQLLDKVNALPKAERLAIVQAVLSGLD